MKMKKDDLTIKAFIYTERNHNMSWQTVDRILKNKHWSLSKLSNKSGINYQTIRNYRYLKTEPTFKTMCKIADALGVSLDELRGDKNEGDTRR